MPKHAVSIPKAKTLTLVVFAFALGFLSNEYFHARHVPMLSSNTVANTAPVSTAQLEPQSIAPAPEVNEAPGSATSTTLSTPVIAAFSWDLVAQLIASEKYEDAIRLLQTQISNPNNAAQAWYTLGHIYKKQAKPVAALDAWFRALKLEVSAQKIDLILKEIKSSLFLLKESPSLFNDDYSWLIAQFEALVKFTSNDGELHLHMASLYVKLNDNYQAQYHALMAANDPQVKKSAEAILATLSGEKLSEDISIPLVISGNQYIVNATVEGYPVRLLLDTGASLSGLSNNYTAKYPSLLKDTKPIRLNTASGQKNSFLFTVTNINMGSLEFNQHILAQLPMDNAGPFDGLLGVDILGRFDFVIDQDASVLKLKSRKK